MVRGVKGTVGKVATRGDHERGSYQLAAPIALGASDVVTVRCVYDNTPEHLARVGYPEAPRSVTHGEGSGDEMCIGYLTVTD